MRKVPLGDNLDMKVIARGTPGFSGADLANLINEAALFAAKEGEKRVMKRHFEKAKDKVIMGAERRSMVMPEHERENTAYHESGHTVVAKVLKEHTDPVHKVTIIPRGRALGVTMQLPKEDRYSHDRKYLLARIAVLMGGRIAEEVFMDQMTTGASNDFEVATDLAENMVTKWGMSDALGPRVYGKAEGEVFMGRDMGSQKSLSASTQDKVDAEITRIIDEEYARARKIIEDERDKLEIMAKALLEWETLDADQIDDIMDGKPPRSPEDIQAKKSDDDKKAKAAKTSDKDASDDGQDDKGADDSTSSDPDLPDPNQAI